MPPKSQSSNAPNTGQSSSVAERLHQANNVLLTVSNNPSVDQLAACIGLTLVLNKMDKHGTAVFSGKIPSTIEFLEPEKTIEKNTDSLRDFIIALDKSKADKLRYKVEDEVVRIFITPYKTKITEKDFDFSQGDFNVDVVVALGVKSKSDLDNAITTHGRILHDASIISINTKETTGSRLGNINWLSDEASSLCEMVADLVSELDNDHFDKQVATALLTGIVSETDRFSNEKSNPHMMSVASKLMEAGASTQLVTSKLEEATSTGKLKEGEDRDGELSINHAEKSDEASELPEAKENIPPPPDNVDLVEPDEDEVNSGPKDDMPLSGGTTMITEPPKMGGQLTANSEPEHARYDPSTDPLSADSSKKSIINRKKKESSNRDENQAGVDDKQTLEDIEKSVDSPHLHGGEKEEPTRQAEQPLKSAREAVDEATKPNEESGVKSEALGAQYLYQNDGANPPPPAMPDSGQTEETAGQQSQEYDQSQYDNEEEKPSNGPPPPVPPPLPPTP